MNACEILFWSTLQYLTTVAYSLTLTFKDVSKQCTIYEKCVWYNHAFIEVHFKRLNVDIVAFQKLISLNDYKCLPTCIILLSSIYNSIIGNGRRLCYIIFWAQRGMKQIKVYKRYNLMLNWAYTFTNKKFPERNISFRFHLNWRWYKMIY